MIKTDFHGVWKIVGRDGDFLALQQGRVRMLTTIEKMTEAGWNPVIKEES